MQREVANTHALVSSLHDRRECHGQLASPAAPARMHTVVERRSVDLA